MIRIGADVARPEGYKTAVVEGDDPYERAAAIDRFFSAARGARRTTSCSTRASEAEWAMPAAAWAARSGDAVLPVSATRSRPPIGGAPRARAPERLRARARDGDLERGGGPAREAGSRRSVDRIEGPTPVENAIAFARYEKGDFGWGVVVPGYNFTVASTTRPLDAAAAAALATRGVFAPLLPDRRRGRRCRRRSRSTS